MIGYASRTGTKRNLAGLRDAGWHLLVSATGCLRSEGFPYALDNGAWTAFQQGRPFDEAAFKRALRKMGARAEWTVIPDVVAGGLASLEFSLKWMRHVLDESNRGLIAVQDGMTPDDVRPLLGPRVGMFVGGSTEWKLSSMPAWGRLAKETESWLHVGRVNSCKRIHYCTAVGAHSFDGTSATRFAVTLPRLNGALQQQDLFGGVQ